MDYNIYIHDKTSQKKPTQARKGGGTNTTAKEQTSSSSGSADVATLKEMKAAWSSFGKGIVAVAVVKKAIDIAVKTVDTVEPFVSRETGDYRFNVWWNNAKAAVNMVTNPISSILSWAANAQQIRLNNKRQEQNRLLVGDAELNTMDRKV